MNHPSSPKDQDIQKILRDMGLLQAEYPPDLLSARRKAFLNQIALLKKSEVKEELSPADQKVIDILTRLKAADGKYPSNLLAARRSAIVNQVASRKQASRWRTLLTAIQNQIAFHITVPQNSTVMWLRTSLVVAGLFLAAFVGFLSYANRTPTTAEVPVERGMVQSGRILTTDGRETSIICKPGYQPPLCLAGEFKKTQDLTFHGNGTARPAVAKDTMPGYGRIHQAANLNDGMYGPGSAWISRSPDSWVKIDLGRATAINTVEFGRDRLGKYNDRSPGQFVISVALYDDIYADGNSSNDDQEYQQVFSSEQTGFNGTISGPETVIAQFDLKVARYIKISFEKAGTAIDEVEVFMIQPPAPDNHATRPPEDDDRPSIISTSFVPTNTPRPADTATIVPTNTPLPTDTVTPLPTNTPTSTDTATPPPTSTPLPPDTATPLPTGTPPPTGSPVPVPTDLLFLTEWPPGPDDRIRPTRNPFFEP
jgi:hypothetical protein